MSIKNVEKFFDLIRSDENIAKELIKINNKLQKKDSVFDEEHFIKNEIIPIAKKHGINFTAKEFLEYAANQVSELSDEDLLNISGGASRQSVALGFLLATLGSFINVAATNSYPLVTPIVMESTQEENNGSHKKSGSELQKNSSDSKEETSNKKHNKQKNIKKSTTNTNRLGKEKSKNTSKETDRVNTFALQNRGSANLAEAEGIVKEAQFQQDKATNIPAESNAIQNLAVEQPQVQQIQDEQPQDQVEQQQPIEQQTEHKEDQNKNPEGKKDVTNNAQPAENKEEVTPKENENKDDQSKKAQSAENKKEVAPKENENKDDQSKKAQSAENKKEVAPKENENKDDQSKKAQPAEQQTEHKEDQNENPEEKKDLTDNAQPAEQPQAQDEQPQNKENTVSSQSQDKDTTPKNPDREVNLQNQDKGVAPPDRVDGGNSKSRENSNVPASSPDQKQNLSENVVSPVQDDLHQSQDEQPQDLDEEQPNQDVQQQDLDEQIIDNYNNSSPRWKNILKFGGLAAIGIAAAGYYAYTGELPLFAQTGIALLSATLGVAGSQDKPVPSLSVKASNKGSSSDLINIVDSPPSSTAINTFNKNFNNTTNTSFWGIPGENSPTYSGFGYQLYHSPNDIDFTGATYIPQKDSLVDPLNPPIDFNSGNSSTNFDVVNVNSLSEDLDQWTSPYFQGIDYLNGQAPPSLDGFEPTDWTAKMRGSFKEDLNASSIPSSDESNQTNFSQYIFQENPDDEFNTQTNMNNESLSDNEISSTEVNTNGNNNSLREQEPGGNSNYNASDSIDSPSTNLNETKSEPINFNTNVENETSETMQIGGPLKESIDNKSEDTAPKNIGNKNTNKEASSWSPLAIAGAIASGVVGLAAGLYNWLRPAKQQTNQYNGYFADFSTGYTIFVSNSKKIDTNNISEEDKQTIKEELIKSFLESKEESPNVNDLETIIISDSQNKNAAIKNLATNSKLTNRATTCVDTPIIVSQKNQEGKVASATMNVYVDNYVCTMSWNATQPDNVTFSKPDGCPKISKQNFEAAKQLLLKNTRDANSKIVSPQEKLNNLIITLKERNTRSKLQESDMQQLNTFSLNAKVDYNANEMTFTFGNGVTLGGTQIPMPKGKRCAPTNTGLTNAQVFQKFVKAKFPFKFQSRPQVEGETDNEYNEVMNEAAILSVLFGESPQNADLVDRVNVIQQADEFNNYKPWLQTEINNFLSKANNEIIDNHSSDSDDSSSDDSSFGGSGGGNLEDSNSFGGGDGGHFEDSNSFGGGDGGNNDQSGNPTNSPTQHHSQPLAPDDSSPPSSNKDQPTGKDPKFDNEKLTEQEKKIKKDTKKAAQNANKKKRRKQKQQENHNGSGRNRTRYNSNLSTSSSVLSSNEGNQNNSNKITQGLGQNMQFPNESQLIGQTQSEAEDKRENETQSKKSNSPQNFTDSDYIDPNVWGMGPVTKIPENSSEISYLSEGAEITKELAEKFLEEGNKNHSNNSDNDSFSDSSRESDDQGGNPTQKNSTNPQDLQGSTTGDKPAPNSNENQTKNQVPEDNNEIADDEDDENQIDKNVLDSGFCGDPNVNNGENVKWRLYKNGKLEILGQGDAENFLNSKTLAHLSEIIKTANIGNGVSSLGDSMFINCKNLETITLPESLKEIKASAFWGCSSLQEIKIPSNVTSIGSNAFNSCSSLKELVIPASVSFIDVWAFINCPNLDSVTYNGLKNPAESTYIFAPNPIEINYPSIYVPEDYESEYFGEINLNLPDSYIKFKDQATTLSGYKSPVKNMNTPRKNMQNRTPGEETPKGTFGTPKAAKSENPPVTPLIGNDNNDSTSNANNLSPSNLREGTNENEPQIDTLSDGEPQGENNAFPNQNIKGDLEDSISSARNNIKKSKSYNNLADNNVKKMFDGVVSEESKENGNQNKSPNNDNSDGSDLPLPVFSEDVEIVSDSDSSEIPDQANITKELAAKFLDMGELKELSSWIKSIPKSASSPNLAKAAQAKLEELEERKDEEEAALEQALKEKDQNNNLHNSNSDDSSPGGGGSGPKDSSSSSDSESDSDDDGDGKPRQKNGTNQQDSHSSDKDQNVDNPSTQNSDENQTTNQEPKNESTKIPEVDEPADFEDNNNEDTQDDNNFGNQNQEENQQTSSQTHNVQKPFSTPNRNGNTSAKTVTPLVDHKNNAETITGDQQNTQLSQDGNENHQVTSNLAQFIRNFKEENQDWLDSENGRQNNAPKPSSLDNFLKNYAKENQGWFNTENGRQNNAPKPSSLGKFLDNFTKENQLWLTPSENESQTPPLQTPVQEPFSTPNRNVNTSAQPVTPLVDHKNNAEKTTNAQQALQIPQNENENQQDKTNDTENLTNDQQATQLPQNENENQQNQTNDTENLTNDQQATQLPQDENETQTGNVENPINDQQATQTPQDENETQTGNVENLTNDQQATQLPQGGNLQTAQALQNLNFTQINLNNPMPNPVKMATTQTPPQPPAKNKTGFWGFLGNLVSPKKNNNETPTNGTPQNTQTQLEQEHTDFAPQNTQTQPEQMGTVGNNNDEQTGTVGNNNDEQTGTVGNNNDTQTLPEQRDTVGNNNDEQTGTVGNNNDTQTLPEQRDTVGNNNNAQTPPEQTDPQGNLDVNYQHHWYNTEEEPDETTNNTPPKTPTRHKKDDKEEFNPDSPYNNDGNPHSGIDVYD